MISSPHGFRLAAILIGLAGASSGAQIPAGQTLEARILGATGSKISKTGDAIEAVLIAPVVSDRRQILPSGILLGGRVSDAAPLGLGFKRQTARLAYEFGWLTLPDGNQVLIEAKLRLVDTAREHVNTRGQIYGIRPTTNLSSSLAFYAWRLAWLDPMLAIPVFGVKFMFARSPDPEIYFPPGTEVVLELARSIDVPDQANLSEIQPLVRADLRAAKGILQVTNGQRAVDKNGNLSDRVNLVIIATEPQLRRAFEASGWKGADRRSFKSIVKTYRSLIERAAYHRAPVNNLLLDGSAPQMVVQKSLNTFAKRHHGRLWRGTATESGQHVWAMAATEDTGIRFSVGKLRFVHRTDPNIDNERAKVVTDLAFTGCLESAGLVDRRVHLGLAPMAAEMPTQTDSRLAVVRLNECETARGSATIQARDQRRSSKMSQFWSAFQEDLVRSNVLFIGVNTTKLATAVKGVFVRRTASPRGRELAQQQEHWLAASTPSYNDVLHQNPTPVVALPQD